MGIPSELRDAWANHRRSSPAASFVIAAPHEQSSESQNTIREAVTRGMKTAVVAGLVAAVPTLVGCRVIPWAKANLNHVAQSLIISSAAISGFFITADKTILKNAKENTIGKHERPT